MSVREMNCSNIQEYVEYILKNYYIKLELLKKSFDSTITHYRHIASQKDIIVIESTNSNDSAYRELLGLATEHLPKIYEVYSTPEKLIVFEEYIQGETLDKVIKKQAISHKEVVAFMLELCDALEILHSFNIIHRDVKPSNIIISPDGLKLIDFNIARLVRSNRQGDTIPLGSVGYAAPEQYGISQTSPATDIYAVGVLFNELLTGKHPTEGIASGKAGKIISRCLLVEKDKRYKNVAQLRAEIRRIRL